MRRWSREAVSQTVLGWISEAHESGRIPTESHELCQGVYVSVQLYDFEYLQQCPSWLKNHRRAIVPFSTSENLNTILCTLLQFHFVRSHHKRFVTRRRKNAVWNDRILRKQQETTPSLFGVARTMVCLVLGVIVRKSHSSGFRILTVVWTLNISNWHYDLGFFRPCFVSLQWLKHGMELTNVF